MKKEEEQKEKEDEKEEDNDQGKGQKVSDDFQIVSLFKDLMRGLLNYVRTHHADGLNWNSRSESRASVSPKTGRVRVEA